MKTVGFIGLGVMGKLMAANLAKKFKVRSYDPMPQQEALIWKVLLAYSFATDARRTHSVIKTFNPSL